MPAVNMAKKGEKSLGDISYSRLSPPAKGRAGCSKGRCVLCCVLSGVAVIVCFVSISVLVYSQMFPLHASCKVDWKINTGCNVVQKKIVDQIELWKGPENCKGGQKCLYQFLKQSSNSVEATHETPTKHYVDALTFSFSQKNASTCDFKGYSTSKTWYAVLDMGTNYCNLHNLITGAGLDTVHGYKEMTSSSVCTQYSSADCTKY